MNETNRNHVELYQLKKLASLLDEFEREMDAHISGKVKWEEDYPNILLQVAGKASLTMRAIIVLCREGLPDAALALARQIYEQSMILCFFEKVRQQPGFSDYVEDYFTDYDIQREKYFRWRAEHVSDDPDELKECTERINNTKKKAHREVKGDYWWAGERTFADLVQSLIANPNKQIALHFSMAHLCYMRASKEVHGGCLGNRLRLGSSPAFCGIDNSVKTTGHDLPLYFSVSSFVLIAIVVFGFFKINFERIVRGFDELEDLYASIFSAEEAIL